MPLSGYTPFITWADAPATTSPLSAANLTGSFNTVASYAETLGAPQITTTVKSGLTGLVRGRMVYDTTLNQLQVYNGTTWASPQAQAVPPMIKAQPNTSGTLGTSTGTVLRFDVASGTNPGTQTGQGFTTDPTLTAGTSALITINTAGVYLITLSAVITWTGTLTAYSFYINQTVSGGTTQACSTFQTGVALTGGAAFNVSGITSLNAGDTLQGLFSWVGATSPVYGATDSRNYMSAMFVGRTS